MLNRTTKSPNLKLFEKFLKMFECLYVDNKIKWVLKDGDLTDFYIFMKDEFKKMESEEFSQ